MSEGPLTPFHSGRDLLCPDERQKGGLIVGMPRIRRRTVGWFKCPARTITGPSNCWNTRLFSLPHWVPSNLTYRNTPLTTKPTALCLAQTNLSHLPEMASLDLVFDRHAS